MEIDLDLVRQTFVAEADEQLVVLEETLVALEARPDDPEPIRTVFRLVHTIKGSAAMVGFDNVAEFAHLLEDALSIFRDGATQLTPVQVTLLLQAVDSLRGLVTAAARGNTTHVRSADRAIVAKLMPSGSDAMAVDGAESRQGSAVQSAGTGAAQQAGRTLRVGMHRLDALLDLTGEIAVARGRLLAGLARSAAATDETVSTAAEVVDRLLSDMQEQVMRMRLVPLGPVFRQHLRTVRDIAATHGKIIRLEIEGEDVEVDASVVDHLRDPLTHLVRNGTDHGIEYPAARKDAGKDPCGTLRLRARHEGGTVVIELSDDGAGLNRDRILSRGRELGLVPEGAVPPDAEIYRLIFVPGFSTADAVTELSGRGVGMDVVHRNIEALRGTVDVRSEMGVGTTISIRLPLTVAIIQGFTVGVGTESYVVPLETVTECIELPAADRTLDQPTGVFDLRGKPLPYVRLGRLFDLPDAPAARENIVVVGHAGQQAGLVVDRLLGETQAVIKPLGKALQRLAGISGSTILGDGRVALILDVPDLLQRALRQSSASA